jgi:D-ribose pyranose/furanose isomerase RbsD
MAEIIKKVYTKFFEKILSGEKKFEMRLADEEYNIEDILILKEINENREFTGREIKKKITYLAKTKDCDYWPQEEIDKYGFVVLGFKD